MRSGAAATRQCADAASCTAGTIRKEGEEEEEADGSSGGGSVAPDDGRDGRDGRGKEMRASIRCKLEKEKSGSISCSGGREEEDSSTDTFSFAEK
jgi:hypothetical protein